ncbi:MAG: potassium channel protein [Myxococcales bacterium]|nr:potassium channel protein [Myxococcales bacterium]MCB9533000.1 potassium channel protein [Myxococcales bacterium]
MSATRGTERLRVLVRATLLLLGVCAVGTVGYKLIGGPTATWLDAAYMTGITLTTVGYEEVIDLSGSPSGRIFTLALLVSGVGTFVYFFSQIMGFIVEGSLDRFYVRLRMQRHIASLTDHYIVCGASHTGVHVVEELRRARRSVVLVDRDSDAAHAAYDASAGGLACVVGDATDDDILRQAGIERARGLVACFSSDKDNLIVAFSARALAPGLRIVCRCVDDRVAPKIRHAGADAVISPNSIGGLRMVSELVRPISVSYFDSMVRAHDGELALEELTVRRETALDGMTLRELRSARGVDVLVVALHDEEAESRGERRWRHNPDGAAELRAGTTMVFVGGAVARAELERLAAAPKQV